MGKSNRFNPDEFDEPSERIRKARSKTKEIFLQKSTPKVEAPRSAEEVKPTKPLEEPKKEEKQMADKVTISGEVVFGYKDEAGQPVWFEESKTRTDGGNQFFDPGKGKQLVRLYMKGIRLETGYVLSWKNAFPEKK